MTSSKKLVDGRAPVEVSEPTILSTASVRDYWFLHCIYQERLTIVASARCVADSIPRLPSLSLLLRYHKGLHLDEELMCSAIQFYIGYLRNEDGLKELLDIVFEEPTHSPVTERVLLYALRPNAHTSRFKRRLSSQTTPSYTSKNILFFISLRKIL